MNTTIRYAAVIAAFAAATVAFVQGATWAGVLAVLAGILGAASIITTGKANQ